MSRNDKLILLGVIYAAHGISGEVTLKSFTSNPGDICNYNLEDIEGKKYSIIRKRIKKDNILIVKFCDCNDRNQAMSLIGTKLYCSRDDLASLEGDEYYFDDLIDAIVFDNNDQEIGIVTGVHNFGAGDILEIKFYANNKSEMFPFTKEFFPTISQNKIVISASAISTP